MQAYEESWRAMWRSLGVTQVDPALLPSLVQRYSEPQRKYHTLQHLDACMAHFADLQAQAQRPAEVAVALGFHDAVYDVGPRRAERSRCPARRGATRARSRHGDLP